MNFTLYKSRVSFDANGDIRKGYDIIMWNWSGPSWAFDVIGTFRVSPERLILKPGKALWHTSDGQVLSCSQHSPVACCLTSCVPVLLLWAFPTAGQGEVVRGWFTS